MPIGVEPSLTRVRFRPLLGDGPDEPLCGVLEIDECTLLLDVGCTERFDLAALEPLRALAPSIDAVLLSHADLAHLGGLAYAYGALGLRCPVYATLPVWRMGQMFIYDAFQARASECGGDVDGFDLDDVDDAFAHVTQLKYSQTVRLRGPCAQGVSITPLPAGRTLGGALWRITREAEDVLYAPDIGAEQERLFNATALASVRRPSALIVTAHALSRELPPRKQRVAAFLNAAVGALRAGAPVLVPVDSAGRCLEIAHVLDAHWASAKLAHYPIALVGHTALNTLEFAKAQMEWMSDAVIRAFDVSGQPLAFKHVYPCHSLDELASFLADAPSTAPALVLVTTEACDMGLSRALLAEWLAEPARLVILPTDAPPHSTARRLRHACAPGGGDSAGGGAGAAVPSQPARTVRLPRWVQLPLVGDALEAWRERRAAQRRLEAYRRRQLLAAATAPASEGAAVSAMAAAEAEAAPASAVQNVLALAHATAVGAHALMPHVTDRFTRADEWGELVSEREWGELARVAEASARDSGEAGLLARTASLGGRAPHGGSSGGKRSADEAKLGRPTRAGGRGEGENEEDEGEEDAEDADAVRRAAALAPGSLRHRLLKSDARGGGDDDAGAGADSADAGANAAPTTWVEELGEPVQVRCRVLHVDLGGDVDARSFRALLGAVAPRALVLLRASTADKAAARAAAAKSGCRRVSAPACGEVIDLSSGVQTLKVRLPDAFIDGLHFQQIGQWDVARVRARLRPADNGARDAAVDEPGGGGGAAAAPAVAVDEATMGVASERAVDGNGTGECSASADGVPRAEGADALADVARAGVPMPGTALRLPTLWPLAADEPASAGGGASDGAARALAPLAGSRPAERPSTLLAKGDVRLSDLRGVLTRAGHVAEFEAGVLVVNGSVRLRRGGAGQVAIDGPWSDDYFAVRQLLYAQFWRV
ncbi:hypothetical protein KFE25_000212 [Diacronema lutheri]|uniref:Cleavage and polyadenylation specificity factor subunit 2 n=1 Tax=Diacronema lutheri TaxID=2081491 RepID=A0A8J5XNY6_DIALT|nr:hypothetical protein KFE25_000212 [Diacronema lutheri]